MIDYDMLILVVSWAYKDHAQFHHLLYSFQTHVRKAQNMVTRCASYRHYVMNKWEKEMTEVDKKKFQRGYKKVIRAMLKSLNGRQEVMTYGVGLINKKINNSQ